jgi:hypothetical protein
MHSTSKVPGLGADWNAMRVRVSGGYMLRGLHVAGSAVALAVIGCCSPRTRWPGLE